MNRFFSQSALRYCGGLLVAIALAACGGGGSSVAPQPAPSTSLPGSGATPKLDRLVTLTVNVPGPTTALASAHKLAGTGSATPAPPYISPNIGSMTIVLQTVDGIAITEPVKTIEHDFAKCTASCSVAIGSIQAALGTNGYVVKTYALAGATGALLSIGIVDIDVPTPGSTAIGSNATLSIGGYVDSIVLHVTPDPPFVLGVAGTASVVAQAIDATGASIVGNVTFATPITVSLANTPFFLFDKQFSTVTVPSPQTTPIALFYTGGNTSRATILATTLDATGATIAATPLPIVLATPVPSPTPTLGPTPPPATALYIHDSQNELFYEVDNPQSQSVAVRRLQLPPPNGSPGIPDCTNSAAFGSFNPYSAPAFSGFTVDGLNNFYVATHGCLSAQSGGTLPLQQILGIPASAVGNVSADVISATTTLDQNSNDFIRLFFDGRSNQVLMGGEDSSNQTGFGQDSVQGFLAPSTGQLPKLTFNNKVFGATCFPQLLPIVNCPNGTLDTYEAGYGMPVVTDSSGNLYVGFSYGIVDANSTPLSDIGYFAAPVDLSVKSPVANLVIASTAFTSPVDGSPLNETQLSFLIPSEAVDDRYLYVLNLGADGYGLSNCGTLGQTGTSSCSDGAQHDYVTMYSLAQITSGAGASLSSTPLKPSYVLGGDSVGRFGPGVSNVPGLGANDGQRLVVSNGMLYVANPYGATCDTNCAQGSGDQANSEIDIFNINALPPPPNAGDPPVVLLNFAPIRKITAQTLGTPAVPGIFQDLAIGTASGVTGGFTSAVRSNFAKRHVPARRFFIPPARRIR